MHEIYEENGLDWQRVFKKEFISSRMKMLKPSREIFDAAAAEIGLPPEEILFIDDSQTNVDGALAAGWQAGLLVGMDPAKVTLLKELAKDYPIYGLSNNNEISVQRMHEIYEENGLDWQRVFKKEFISSRMKMLKPSREIFDAAAAEIGLPPEEILFIDDSQTNVDGALAAGWQAGLYVQGTDLGACVKKFI